MRRADRSPQAAAAELGAVQRTQPRDSGRFPGQEGPPALRTLLPARAPLGVRLTAPAGEDGLSLDRDATEASHPPEPRSLFLGVGVCVPELPKLSAPGLPDVSGCEGLGPDPVLIYVQYFL